MDTVGFGYRCQECGRGTVVENRIAEYRTKIRGYPFTVRDAGVGVCDLCGAEHFAAQETERWERMFESDYSKHFLTSQEIQELRKSLHLSMEQFAFLTGCTRQSVYNWERIDRTRPQSRMADLLLKLLRKSRDEGSVSVINALVEEARGLGVQIHVGPSYAAYAEAPMVVHEREVPYESGGKDSLGQRTADRRGKKS